MIIPQEWFVVFKYKSALRWCNWIPGRFHHCFAMAYIEELKSWVFVEFAPLAGAAIAFCPDTEVNEWLGEASRDAVVVKMPARMTRGWYCGLWCVPLTAHVIGLKSCALLPDGLFRDCLRQGGEIVIAGD